MDWRGGWRQRWPPPPLLPTSLSQTYSQETWLRPRSLGQVDHSVARHRERLEVLPPPHLRLPVAAGLVGREVGGGVPGQVTPGALA